VFSSQIINTGVSSRVGAALPLSACNLATGDEGGANNSSSMMESFPNKSHALVAIVVKVKITTQLS